MRIDLEQALADIAGSVHDDATADRMTGQVRTMVGRVRRRRAARHTAQGAVGVGAAAAVGLVGVNLDSVGGGGAGTPWGSGTADPDRPAQDLRFPECGALAPGTPGGDTDTQVGLLGELGPEDAVGLDVGHLTERGVHVSVPTSLGELRVSYLTEGPAVGEIRVVGVGVPVSGATVLRDGRVASESLSGAAVETAGIAVETSGVPISVLVVEAVDCRTGERLPAGDYEVAVTTALEDGGTEVTRVPLPILPTTEAERLATAKSATEAEAERAARARAEEERRVAEEESARLEEETRLAAETLQRARAEVARHLGAAHDAFPACASRLPVADDGPLVLELGDLGSPEDWTGPAPSAPEAVLRTTGGRHVLANADVGAAGLLVLREGVVVGGRVPDGDQVDLLDLGASDEVRLTTTPTLDVCGATTADGGALRLPPGDYQVVATLEVVLKEVVTADGEAVSVTEPLVVTSTPRDVTID